MTVAELGSVTLASQQLHMTQPAVSNILKQLQEYYDCPLTETISRKLYLTEYGQKLYESYLELQEMLNRTETEINLLKGTVSGTLKVATVSTAKYFMPKLLGEFKQNYPGINIKLSVMNREGIIKRLQQNLDDFTVMSHPPDSIKTVNQAFYRDELIVVSSRNAKLNSKKKISLNDLQNENWLQRESGSGTLFAAERIFKKQKFQPSSTTEIGDIEAIKQSIIANFGIGVVSRASCKLELEDKLLKELDITPFPVEHKWYIVYNSGKALSTLSTKFFEFIKGKN